jgi:uncharacterized protein
MDRFVIALPQLELGASRHEVDLELVLPDAAGEAESYTVHAVGDVDNMGTRLLVRLQLRGRADSCCHRCLEPFERAVEAAAEFVVQIGDQGLGDEVTTVGEGAAELDLTPQARETLIVEEPIRAVCRPECKGLCPQCGANLNLAACGCRALPDARWDALKKLADRVEP